MTLSHEDGGGRRRNATLALPSLPGTMQIVEILTANRILWAERGRVAILDTS